MDRAAWQATVHKVAELDTTNIFSTQCGFAHLFVNLTKAW